MGTHRSRLLDAYINKRVKIKFQDGSRKSGTLVKTEYCGRYGLNDKDGMLHTFYKSHVIDIEEV